MKHFHLFLVICLLLITGCGPSPEAIATQTATAATAIAAAWTATPTSTATPTFTPTPTQTFTPTPTPTNTSTPVPPTATPTNTPSPTASPTNTSTHTPTPIPPTATPTPIPPTATPTPLPGPQAGHWEGEPSVSFEVTVEGDIRDFKIIIPITGVGTCTITLDQIDVKADSTFLEGELDPDGTLAKNSLRGKFDTPTTLTGAYSKLLFCGNIMSMSNQEGDWSAEWKGP